MAMGLASSCSSSPFIGLFASRLDTPKKILSVSGMWGSPVMFEIKYKFLSLIYNTLDNISILFPPLQPHPPSVSHTNRRPAVLNCLSQIHLPWKALPHSPSNFLRLSYLGTCLQHLRHIYYCLLITCESSEDRQVYSNSC